MVAIAVGALAVGNVECEIRGSVGDCKVYQLEILEFAEVLLKVAVESHAAVEQLRELASVEAEPVENRGVDVICKVEIGIVENSVVRNPVSLFLIPVVILGTQALGGNEFLIELEFLVGGMQLVLLADCARDKTAEFHIGLVVVAGETHELGRFVDSVLSYGGEELVHLDVSSLGRIEHSRILGFIEESLVGCVVFVNPVEYVHQILLVVLCQFEEMLLEIIA